MKVEGYAQQRQWRGMNRRHMSDLTRNIEEEMSYIGQAIQALAENQTIPNIGIVA